MQCPRCSDKLSAIDTAEGPTVDFCASCGGTWYDDGELEAVLGLSRRVRIRKLAFDSCPGPDCPRCSSPMEEVGYPPEQPVRIDVCTACHGIWLDVSELAQLRTARGGRPKAHEYKADSGGAFIVPMRAERPRFEVGTFVMSLFVMAFCTAGVLGLLSVLGAMEHLKDDGNTHADELAAVGGALLGLPIGAAVVGRLSPGFTIWEPAAAAVPVLGIFLWYFSGSLQPLALGVVGIAGLVFAVLGAVMGERLQES